MFYDLDTNKNYCFAIKTADEVANWSALSNVVIGSTLLDTAPPSPVTDLRILDTTTTSITLIWTAPGDDDTLGQASAYNLRYSSEQMNDLNFDSASAVTSTKKPSPAGICDTVTISGLRSDTQYYFAVKTRDEMVNWSAISNILLAKTQSVDRTPPGTITDLRIVDSSLTSLTLTWTAPGDDGDVGTTSAYDIRLHYNPIEDLYCPFGCDYDPTDDCYMNYWCVSRVCNPPQPSPAGTQEIVTISALASLRKYYIRIKASDGYLWSAASNQVLGNTRPGEDTIPPAPIINLGAVAIRSTSVTLMWTVTGDDGNLGQATEYDLRYMTGVEILEENWETATRIESIGHPTRSRSTDSLVIDGLIPSTTYSFAIKSIDDEGIASEISNTVILKTTAFADTWHIARQKGTGNAVVAAADGGFVFTFGDNRAYCMKMNAPGTVNEWYKKVGDNGGGNLQALAVDEGGNVVIVGRRIRCDVFHMCWEDVYLGYLSPNGQTVWEQYYPVQSCIIASSVSFADDGGFVFAASHENCNKAHLVRTDAAGNKIWEKSFEGMNQCHDVLNVGSGFLMAGKSGATAHIMKVDDSGSVEWTGSYGEEQDAKGRAILQLNPNAYLMAGNAPSSGVADGDVYLVWVDSLGHDEVPPV
jgi:hypothetical protein